jgi:hypothetical protein
MGVELLLCQKRIVDGVDGVSTQALWRAWVLAIAQCIGADGSMDLSGLQEAHNNNDEDGAMGR